MTKQRRIQRRLASRLKTGRSPDPWLHGATGGTGLVVPRHEPAGQPPTALARLPWAPSSNDLATFNRRSQSASWCPSWLEEPPCSHDHAEGATSAPLAHHPHAVHALFVRSIAPAVRAGAEETIDPNLDDLIVRATRAARLNSTWSMEFHFAGAARPGIAPPPPWPTASALAASGLPPGCGGLLVMGH